MRGPRRLLLAIAASTLTALAAGQTSSYRLIYTAVP